MYDCLTSGPGHFLVHNPQISTFTCHRCKDTFFNFRIQAPRPGSLQPPLSTLGEAGGRGRVDSGNTKAAWRCIITPCKMTACEPCAEFIHSEMEVIRSAKEEADEAGIEFNMEAELTKLDSKMAIKRSNDGGASNGDGEDDETVEGGVNDESGTDDSNCRRICEYRDEAHRLHKELMTSRSMDLIQSDAPIEVDDEDNIDEDYETYKLVFAARPFTRSVAAAAAASIRTSNRSFDQKEIMTQ